MDEDSGTNTRASRHKNIINPITDILGSPLFIENAFISGAIIEPN